MGLKPEEWDYVVRKRPGKPPADVFLDVARYNGVASPCPQLLVGDAWLPWEHKTSDLIADAAEGNLHRVDSEIHGPHYHSAQTVRAELPEEMVNEYLRGNPIVGLVGLVVLSLHRLDSGPWAGERLRQWWSAQRLECCIESALPEISIVGKPIVGSFQKRDAAEKYITDELAKDPHTAFVQGHSAVNNTTSVVGVRNWIFDRLERLKLAEKEKHDALLTKPTKALSNEDFAKAFQARLGRPRG